MAKGTTKYCPRCFKDGLSIYDPTRWHCCRCEKVWHEHELVTVTLDMCLWLHHNFDRLVEELNA